MQIAAKEAKDVNGHFDKPVAIDGTWQKHGHTSLNGAVIEGETKTMIGNWVASIESLGNTVVTSCFYSGKVLDASVLSRLCKCPNKIHNDNCSGTVENSESMEVPGAIEIFQRSQSLHGLQYTKCLGFGDALACKTVNEMQLAGKSSNLRHRCSQLKNMQERDQRRLRETLSMTDMQPFLRSLQILILGHQQVSPCEPLNDTSPIWTSGAEYPLVYTG
ncbi:uncharacterized protein TNCV_3642531 [Trichonephila clavipes]|nr:uncharacterized protein TNCV_3642531 [Trichonephila clavipes]